MSISLGVVCSCTMTNNQQNNTFYGLGIAPGMLKRLDDIGFTIPTPIQRKAIPVAITGEDVIGIAQTGTGKTIAFSIPMLQQIAAKKKRGLILLPTRELAIQVDEELKKIAQGSGLKTAIIIGGASEVPQKKALAARPHVIIATPRRLIDRLDQKNVTLDS